MVRTLHPESFVDDATRILRAVRYSARLDFPIEPDTLAALRRDMRYLDAIKGDRVRHELERIFDEERATVALAAAGDQGVLRAIDRSLSVEDATLARLSKLPAAAPNRALLFLCALAYGVARSDLDRLTSRLNLDSRSARAVRDSLSISRSAEELASPRLPARRIHRLLCGLDPVAVRAALLTASGLRLSTEHGSGSIYASCGTLRRCSTATTCWPWASRRVRRSAICSKISWRPGWTGCS